MHPIKSTGGCLPVFAKTHGGKSQRAVPMNLTGADRLFTKQNVTNKGENNDYLVATGPFVDQDIPDNAVIRTISVRINVYSATNRASEEVYWSYFGLKMPGSDPGASRNCANFVTILPTRYEAQEYQVAEYTPEEWGFDTITGEDVKDPSFGIAMRFRSTNQPAIVSIDFVSFTVTWSLTDEVR